MIQSSLGKKRIIHTEDIVRTLINMKSKELNFENYTNYTKGKIKEVFVYIYIRFLYGFTKDLKVTISCQDI